MLVLEAKLKGKSEQYQVLDEAIRTANFIRNKALRYWIDNQGVKQFDLNKYCAVLAKEYEWAKKLNSMARQASAERAWFAISRFFENCKNPNIKKKRCDPGEVSSPSGQTPARFPRYGNADQERERAPRQGYPKFKKRGHSVEYKTSGWKLSEDHKKLTLTDGFKAGQFKLIGTRDLNFYTLKQIKRVRIVRRADGYYAQFVIKVDRKEQHETTGKSLGIDVGLESFYTDSEGNQIKNPRYLRKSEKALKHAQKQVSRKKKGSKNRRKAINKLARKHLKVHRQRKDFAVKTARALVQSSDLVAYENLKVRNLVKNHCLAKSISDASWRMFLEWVEYFGTVFGVEIRSVQPHFTSQDCSQCGHRQKKSLSQRTHQCAKCGTKLHRDHNAALNILAKALGNSGATPANRIRQGNAHQDTVGHTEINASGQIDLCLTSENLLNKSAG
ncbi:MAG: transposase [Cyanobacteria bacterium SBLK]|nr:transposase [Cyanobacteria bacterium SBLK]